MKRIQETGSTDRLAVFHQHRSLLFSIAYRMLGSVADAEDVLQDTFIRWQQSSKDDIQSPQAFLVTIVSRLCINHLQSARVQREEYVGQWLPEPVVAGPDNDPFGVGKLDGSLSMAFLVLLERLTPIERAVFLLREVFEYEYSEVAAILGQSEVNCRQLLRRARQHVGVTRRRFEVSDGKHNDLLKRFLDAVDSGDLSGIVALLAKDVTLHSDGGGKAIAVPNVVRGAGQVARGILGSLDRLLPKALVKSLVSINGEPGLINYLNGKPHSVLTVHVVDGQIHAIYVVTNPDKLANLPDCPK